MMDAAVDKATTYEYRACIRYERYESVYVTLLTV